MKSKRILIHREKQEYGENDLLKKLKERERYQGMPLDFEGNFNFNSYISGEIKSPLEIINDKILKINPQKNLILSKKYFDEDRGNKNQNIQHIVKIDAKVKESPVCKEAYVNGENSNSLEEQTKDGTGVNEFPGNFEKMSQIVKENSKEIIMVNSSKDQIIRVQTNNSFSSFNLVDLKVKSGMRTVYFREEKKNEEKLNSENYYGIKSKSLIPFQDINKECDDFTISAINKPSSVSDTGSCFKSYFSSSECVYQSIRENSKNSLTLSESNESIYESIRIENKFGKISECKSKTLLLALKAKLQHLAIDLKDYSEFGLKMNKNIILSPSNQTHILLPSNHIDDEKYKNNLIQFLRHPKFPNCKTETCKYLQVRKHSQAFDGNLTKLFSTFGMKRRKVHSEKKVFEVEHAFEDNRAYVRDESERLPPQFFKFYKDKEIGFTLKWQRQLRQSEMDDDVETDSEQLQSAGRYILREIGDGIKFYCKNRKNVRNQSLLNQ